MDCSPSCSSIRGILQARILEYGLPFPPPGDRPDPGIEPTSLVPPAWAGRFFTTSTIWEALLLLQKLLILHSWSHGERELQKRSYARPFGQTKNSSPEITRDTWEGVLVPPFPSWEFFFFFFFFPFLQMAAFNEEALSAKIGNLHPGYSQGLHPLSVRREHHCSAG